MEWGLMVMLENLSLAMLMILTMMEEMIVVEEVAIIEEMKVFLEIQIETQETIMIMRYNLNLPFFFIRDLKIKLHCLFLFAMI